MRKTKRTRERPPLAPLDPLGREIQKVLDLVRPISFTDESEGKYDGYCGAASEAYLHLAGGREAGLRVKRLDNNDGTIHWWLEGPRGVIDLTYGSADRRALYGHQPDFAYEKGTGSMFRTGYDRPSKRAAAIIELVESRR